MGTWKGDSNPGGPGGRTRKIQTNKPRGKTSHRGGGGKTSKKSSGGKPPKKSSGGASREVTAIAYGLLGLPLAVVLGVVTWLAHGYGVI